jgi:hypothetical protein
VVAEALQSGRDIYTVFCVGPDEIKERGIRSAQVRLGVGDLVDDLLRRVRRSVREGEGPPHEPDAAFVASFVSSDGRVFQDFIRAQSAALAESQALELARYREMTLTDVQRGPDWWLQSIGGRPSSSRWARLVRRLRETRARA